MCHAGNMFEIADRILAAHESGRPLAVATAVSIDGSAPRTIGTSMAFDGSAVIGSIAGGCVEGAVVEQCELVLADGVSRTVEYGVSDETALSVGLTCGGQLRVLVQSFTPELEAQLRGGRAIASIVSGNAAAHGSRISAERAAAARTGLSVLDCGDVQIEVFFEVAMPQPRLIIFGAMEFSAALAEAARPLGFRVTVCDPRPLFATPARFPNAELVVTWPTEYLATTAIDERTVICVLSHDARFDAELVEQALALPVAYVGAMGSRSTHDRRIASLLERGVSVEALARLHSPIGLDLGASTPEETAISILAEIIAVRTGSTAARLTTTTGSIHASQLMTSVQ